LAATLLLFFDSNGYGQPAHGPEASAEPVSIGAVGAFGPMGNVGAIRLSAPLAEKWSIDLTAGRVDGYGSATRSGLEGGNFAATVRYLWHGRKIGAATGYWLFGPMMQGLTHRTLIISPGGGSTLVVEETDAFTLQVGYGWDWLLKNRVRLGFELAAGGSQGGSNPYVNVFAVWGRPRPRSD
jgi:hypothetical protein